MVLWAINNSNVWFSFIYLFISEDIYNIFGKWSVTRTQGNTTAWSFAQETTLGSGTLHDAECFMIWYMYFTTVLWISTLWQQRSKMSFLWGVVVPESDGEWKMIRGKFLAINAASMSCACPRSPKGLSPAAHLADGTTDLILVRKCSRFDFLRHLLRHTSKDDQVQLIMLNIEESVNFFLN